jgi:hypothetical protein
MLDSQSELSKLEPDSDEVVKLASNLCAAFERTLSMISGLGHEEQEHRDFEWFQHMLLLDNMNHGLLLSNDILSGLQAILGIRLSSSTKNLKGDHPGSTRRLLQAIISLTLFYYEQYAIKEKTSAIFIIGCCTQGSISAYKRELEEWGFFIDAIKTMIRQPDGTYESGQNMEHISDELLIFGQRYSSLVAKE